MYSFVFCRVFIVLVDFRLHCVTTVTPFIRRRSVRRPQYFNSHKTLIACNAIPARSKVTFRLTEGKNVNYITPPLSSAEAPVTPVLLVNTRERNGSGSAGERKRMRGERCFNFSSSQPPRAAGIFFPRHDCRRPLRRRELHLVT